MSRALALSAEDGCQLSAYRAMPAGAPPGGLSGGSVMVQKTFGVDSGVRTVADGWAADGHVALAPVPFDPYPARHGFSSHERASDDAGSARWACARTLVSFRQHIDPTQRPQ